MNSEETLEKLKAFIETLVTYTDKTKDLAEVLIDHVQGIEQSNDELMEQNKVLTQRIKGLETEVNELSMGGYLWK